MRFGTLGIRHLSSMNDSIDLSLTVCTMIPTKTAITLRSSVPHVYVLPKKTSWQFEWVALPRQAMHGQDWIRNFRAAMFDPDPHKQWRSERSRSQFRKRNREGPEQPQPTERKEIPIEAKRDPPPPAKAPWKTSIRMDFIKERPECNFQFRQCHNFRGVQHGVFQICLDRMFPSMHHGLLRISCGRYWWVPLEKL